jgi:NRPS condensation-like uncharacterized protein
MTSIPLNLLDELYLNLDRPQEPWTVHYELHLAQHLDSDRLTSAIETAARRHPLARARLARWRFQDRSYVWEIADELVHVPLHVVACADEAALEVERERLFDTSPSLSTAPPFEMVLARSSDGDTLMLNLHHAAGDGISAARLMLSIIRAYAGANDPIPSVDALAVHDVRTLAAARSAQERSARLATLSRGAWRSLVPPARVAREGGDDRRAYGFELFSLSAEESLTVFARHSKCATVNDVLMAALAMAITGWNSEHGWSERPIALSMPVNLRPAEWRSEVVSNFASWATVWVQPRPGEDLGAVAARVGARTRSIKRNRLAGVSVDLLTVPGKLMIAGKRWLQYLKLTTGDAAVDTASLSNLGRLESLPPDLGAATVWVSPPSQMPLGVAIGVVIVDEQLRLAMRYRHAQFGAASARRFTELYRDVLLG